MKVSDELLAQMVNVFGQAWHERQQSEVPPMNGDRRRAGLRAALELLPDVEPFTFAGYPDRPAYLHPTCGTVVDIDPAMTGEGSMTDAVAAGECDCENTGPWLRIYVERS
jgi:hypothetical protein